MSDVKSNIQEVGDAKGNEQQMDFAKTNEQPINDMGTSEELSEMDTEECTLLDDCAEQFKNDEPNVSWIYFIQIYPWHSTDMSEKFVKLIRLAEFARVVMKKKNLNEKSAVEDKTTTDAENKTATDIEDKITTNDVDKTTTDAQPQSPKMGCLQFYITSRQSAKAVMRSMTWKSMTAKQLTVEITYRDPTNGEADFETAYMELDTQALCKCRHRDKVIGELTDRSIRVSNIPGGITRGFLEVVLSRAYPIVGNKADKSFTATATDRMKKLQDIEDFKGTLDFDCMTTVSCRSFVQAHKQIILNGQDLIVAAVNEKTMVEPINPVIVPNQPKKKNRKKNKARSETRGGWQGATGGGGRGAFGSGQKNFNFNPGFTSPMQPFNNGSGIPHTPMTGRQAWGVGPGVPDIAHLQNQPSGRMLAPQERGNSYPNMNDVELNRFGYNDQPRGFNDQSNGYNGPSNGYNNQIDGYRNVSREYDSWSSRGFPNAGYGYNTHGGQEGLSCGSGGRGLSYDARW